MGQEIIRASRRDSELDDYFAGLGAKRIFLVHGKSMRRLGIGDYFASLSARKSIEVSSFSDFRSNPDYEDVVSAVKVFRASGCDVICAVGGGSAMDVAKCVKLYANMEPSKNYLEQKIIPNEIPLLAVPTTAGSGSEATRFAVIYYRGEKQSVVHESSIPSAVCFDPSALEGLPDYQRKSTMLDAFCHAVESFWSVNSTEGSRGFSSAGIRGIMKYGEGYIKNIPSDNAGMLDTAYIAGRAINITQTTAGHAMCYKLTAMYKIAHGHAAALCVAVLWPYMMEHIKNCADKRGVVFLQDVMDKIAHDMGCEDAEKAALLFLRKLNAWGMIPPEEMTEADIEVLSESVNPVRLKNNPISLKKEDFRELYKRIYLWKERKI